MYKKFLNALACLAGGMILTALIHDAQAATINWASATDGFYTNQTLWVGGVVPGSTDDARIGNASIVTIDGGNKSAGNLIVAFSGNAAFVLNMNPGATFYSSFDIGSGLGIIVSNGTLVSKGTSGVGGSFGRPGSLYLNGGGFLQTNGIFSPEAGVSGALTPTTVQINPGSTFNFNVKLNGGFTLGTTVAAGYGRILFDVNGGTANVTGEDNMNAYVGRWYGADSIGKMTSIVSVASGSLNVFTSATPTSQRLIVGGRGPSFSGNPNTDFDQHSAQLKVSGTGILNVQGSGLSVGRNTDGSGAEFSIFGGDAILNGLIVGDLGKITQTNGVLRFTGKSQFLNESTDSAQHLFMSGGLTLFQGISSNQMTINMGGASAGNLLGQGFYNVQFGGDSMSPFQINLTNEFFGRGTASGGNGIPRDGIMDLGIWTNTTILYSGTTYAGTNGPNSLYTFASLAQTWGWDAFVIIPEPNVAYIFASSALLVWFARRRR